MRTLRSLRMITEDPKISYEQLLAKKHSTRMELADKVLPDLLKAANGASEAARVLEKWDRQTDVDSRGGVLFQLFVDQYFSGAGGIAAKLRVKYDPARPLESGYGLGYARRSEVDPAPCTRYPSFDALQQHHEPLNPLGQIVQGVQCGERGGRQTEKSPW